MADQNEMKPEGQTPRRRGLLRKFLFVSRAYWTSGERWFGLVVLAFVVTSVVGHVYTMVKLNEAGGKLFNALQARSESAFYDAIIGIGLFMLLQLMFIVATMALSQWLELRWRRWLTDYLVGRWLAQRNYYRLRFGGGSDNPDQRIAEDVRLFAAGTMTLGVGGLLTLLTVAAFASVLWTISGPLDLTFGGVDLVIPGYMFWTVLLYWLVGSAVGYLLGWPLVRMNNRQQGFEADFRFGLVRVREKAEGIALYGGEAGEQERAGSVYESLYRNSKRILRQTAAVLGFRTGLGYGPDIIPYVAVAPRYFSGALGLGELMMIGNGFGQISRALAWFLNSFTTYAEWHATLDRLAEFQTELDRLAAQPDGFERQQTMDQSFGLKEMSALLPSGRSLVSGVTLSGQAGENILIQGASGTGKSTIFRVLAGLWPLGRGTLLLPKEGRLLFLPQQPYIPIGSLRNALLFAIQPGQEHVEDGEIVAALEAVGLVALTGRLDDVSHWEQTLSPGEQQRLAIAQALLCKPDWLFLDEATAALDEEQEATVYQVLASRLPQTTIVSIGLRRSVAPFHARVIRLGVS